MLDRDNEPRKSFFFFWQKRERRKEEWFNLSIAINFYSFWSTDYLLINVDNLTLWFDLFVLVIYVCFYFPFSFYSEINCLFETNKTIFVLQSLINYLFVVKQKFYLQMKILVLVEKTPKLARLLVGNWMDTGNPMVSSPWSF